MNITIKKQIIIFFVAAILAPIGDYWHVETVTNYDMFLEPSIANSPIWFIVLVGVFGSSLGLFASIFRKTIDSTTNIGQLLRLAMIAIFACLAIYFATSLVPKENLMLSTLLLMSFALLIWAHVDGKLLSFMIGVIAIFVGMAAEIILVKLGLYHYEANVGIAWGVAPWLAPLFFSLGVGVVKLDEYLEAKFR